MEFHSHFIRGVDPFIMHIYFTHVKRVFVLHCAAARICVYVFLLHNLLSNITTHVLFSQALSPTWSTPSGLGLLSSLYPARADNHCICHHNSCSLLDTHGRRKSGGRRGRVPSSEKVRRVRPLQIRESSGPNPVPFPILGYLGVGWPHCRRFVPHLQLRGDAPVDTDDVTNAPPPSPSSVSCATTDTDVTQCRHEGAAELEHTCPHDRDVALRCYDVSWAGVRFGLPAEKNILKKCLGGEGRAHRSRHVHVWTG